jgi:hypothetical protein
VAAGDVDLDGATADRLVALAEPGFRTATIAWLTGGGNSTVFEVRSSEGRAVVLEVYADLFHWKMDEEVFVYERVRRHGLTVPVPAIFAADDSKPVLIQNVVVMTKIEGRLPNWAATCASS